MRAIDEVEKLNDCKPENFLQFYNTAKEMQQALLENSIKSKKEYEDSRLQIYQIEQYNRKLSSKKKFW